MDRNDSQGNESGDQGPSLLRHAGEEVAGLLRPLPPLLGAPIQVEWAPGLRVLRGRLEPGGGRGKEVHAAGFIRERRIVFDAALRLDPKELARILIHEIFHFAWARLSNGDRQSWRELLQREFARNARGELGWSAESGKRAIRQTGTVTPDRTWSEYSGESFCDTAAWVHLGGVQHAEFTLARRYREIRREWFRALESHRAGGIRI